MEISKDLLALNSDNVYRFITNADIFKKYCDPKMKFNTPFSSPLRKDSNPSFVIYKKGFFIDFATGEKGSAITFVMRLNQINYNDALRVIVRDFDLGSRFISFTRSTFATVNAEFKNPKNTLSLDGAKLSVKKRDFNEDDKEYWSQYNINSEDLKIARIVPISHFFIDTKMFIADKLAYAFLENKDGKLTYKIYQPKNKFIKWMSGNDSSVWELWDQLPKSGKYLVITSSRKDAVCVIKNLKVPSTARQSEATVPKAQVIKELHERFPIIFILMDNDFGKQKNWGQIAAQKLIDQYPFMINIVIPEETGCKDFSDLVSKYGSDKASSILRTIISREMKKSLVLKN